MTQPATVADPVVGLTEKAVLKVRSALASEKPAKTGLRLAVTKGGCSGYEYAMKLVAGPEPGDIVYEVERLPIYVAADSAEVLRGTVLDYQDGLHGAGLRFTNPNAAHSCGCGASFAVEEA